MQNDMMSDMLRADHTRLVARLKAHPMDAMVLAQLSQRSHFRGLVLAIAMGLGAAIAGIELFAFQPGSLNWSGMPGFVMAFLVIAATIGAMGRMIAD